MSLDDFARLPINPFMAEKDRTNGATATPPWWVEQPQRGRYGSKVGGSRVRLLALAGALFVGGCRQLPTPPPDSGASSFQFVDEPPPVKPRVVPTEGPLIDSSFEVEPNYFVEAKPLEPLTKPLYPPKALSGRAGLVIVGVRVLIDAEGRVVEVRPSLLVFSTPTKYSKEFQEAVRTAVMCWRFHPAQRSHVKTNQANEEAGTRNVLQWENTETYFDLSLTFTASGTVLSGSSIK